MNERFLYGNNIDLETTALVGTKFCVHISWHSVGVPCYTLFNSYIYYILPLGDWRVNFVLAHKNQIFLKN